mgnify:FL=1
MFTQQRLKKSVWSSLAIGASGCTINASVIENVRFLAPFVDDIELIVYEYDGVDNYPTLAELAEMAYLAERFNFGYTVHLPSSLSAHPLNQAWQKRALREWRRAVEVLACLNPRAYIWHWESEQLAWQPAADIEAWLEFTEQTAEKFLSGGLLPPKSLCVENLSYDYALIWPIVRRLGLSVCLDVGHIWNSCGNLFPFMSELWPKVGAIHLHGVNSQLGQDHIGLQPENRKNLRLFVSELLDFLPRRSLAEGPLPLTFEVFSPIDWQICWQEFRCSHPLLRICRHPKLAAFGTF